MNNNLKVILGTVSGIIIGGLTVVGANQAIQAIQNTEIKVSLNGKVQEFKDETTGETQYPITYHDRTYLPLRNVAQLAGLNVDYDNNSKTAILTDLNNADVDFDTKVSSILTDIIELEKESGAFWNISKYYTGNGKIYCLKIGEGSPWTIVYNENGEEIGTLEGDFGASDLYLDSEGKLYYYEANLVDGREPNWPEERELVYLEFKDDKILRHSDETYDYTKLEPLTNEEVKNKKLDTIDPNGEFYTYNEYYILRTSNEYSSLVGLVFYDKNLKELETFGTDRCYDLYLDKAGNLIFYNNTRINNVNFQQSENEVDQYLKAKFTVEFKDNNVKQKLLSISMDGLKGPAGQS